MSSKAQLQDYNKRLKAEILKLEEYKSQALIREGHYKAIINRLKEELSRSRSRERKWYHFF